MNDWFDCFNIQVPEQDSRQRMKAYQGLDVQKSIIKTMTDAITQLRVKGRKQLLPFQTAIIISNKSLPELYEYLQKRFNITYILTYRLNQDVLENFFGTIRRAGGLHDHPDPLEFKYRLRSYILGRNEGSLSAGGNVKVDDTPDIPKEKILSGDSFSKVAENITCVVNNTSELEFDSIQYDGLENLAGFICHKVAKEEDVSEISANFTWVDHLSEGGLCKPSQKLMSEIENLEAVFQEMNGDGLLISSDYLQTHINKATAVTCSEKVKRLFFRSRMYFKIRKLNEAIRIKTQTRKRKLIKTIT